MLLIILSIVLWLACAALSVGLLSRHRDVHLTTLVFVILTGPFILAACIFVYAGDIVVIPKRR